MRRIARGLAVVLWLIVFLWVVGIAGDGLSYLLGWPRILTFAIAVLVSGVPLLNTMLAAFLLVKFYDWSVFEAIITLVILSALQWFLWNYGRVGHDDPPR